MSHFKPGDLALIVSSLHPENIGKCVELIKPVAPFAAESFDGWRFREVAGNNAWIIRGDLYCKFSDGLFERSDSAIISEWRLMPLNGDQGSQQSEEGAPVRCSSGVPA